MNANQTALLADIASAKAKLQAAKTECDGLASSAQAKGAPTVKADAEAASAACAAQISVLDKDYSVESEFGAIS